LDVLDLKRGDLRTAQAAADQQAESGAIALFSVSAEGASSIA
jgi:hypothetical protein